MCASFFFLLLRLGWVRPRRLFTFTHVAKSIGSSDNQHRSRINLAANQLVDKTRRPNPFRRAGLAAAYRNLGYCDCPGCSRAFPARSTSSGAKSTRRRSTPTASSGASLDEDEDEDEAPPPLPPRGSGSEGWWWGMDPSNSYSSTASPGASSVRIRAACCSRANDPRTPPARPPPALIVCVCVWKRRVCQFLSQPLAFGVFAQQPKPKDTHPRTHPLLGPPPALEEGWKAVRMQRKSLSNCSPPSAVYRLWWNVVGVYIHGDGGRA